VRATDREPGVMTVTCASVQLGTPRSVDRLVGGRMSTGTSAHECPGWSLTSRSIAFAAAVIDASGFDPNLTSISTASL
jgi:hypothetical protein